MQARTPRYWLPDAPSKLALMGIRFMADGDPAPAPPAPPAPAPAPPAPAPAPPAPPAPAPAPVQQVAYDPDYAHRLREESKGNRERYEKAEQERDAHATRITELEQKLAERDAADEARLREGTVRQLASKAEVAGDADAILDSSKWATASKDLDWSKPADVEAALTKFVTDNPRFKTAPQGPGSSGPIRPAGTGTVPSGRGGLRAALDAAVASGA